MLTKKDMLFPNSPLPSENAPRDDLWMGSFRSKMMLNIWPPNQGWSWISEMSRVSPSELGSFGYQIPFFPLWLDYVAGSCASTRWLIFDSALPKCFVVPQGFSHHCELYAKPGQLDLVPTCVCTFLWRSESYYALRSHDILYFSALCVRTDTGKKAFRFSPASPPIWTETARTEIHWIAFLNLKCFQMFKLQCSSGLG